MTISYLASPYTHPEQRVRQERYLAACKKAAELMLSGKVIFGNYILNSHQRWITQGEAYELEF